MEVAKSSQSSVKPALIVTYNKPKTIKIMISSIRVVVPSLYILLLFHYVDHILASFMNIFVITHPNKMRVISLIATIVRLVFSLLSLFLYVNLSGQEQEAGVGCN